ncbi:MAG: hypothetical protein PHD76_09260 [Methylacidiphilales bacterium]|nr:hypothetical protein [Candidatus Methylacidiphilales bacterium]
MHYKHYRIIKVGDTGPGVGGDGIGLHAVVGRDINLAVIGQRANDIEVGACCGGVVDGNVAGGGACGQRLQVEAVDLGDEINAADGCADKFVGDDMPFSGRNRVGGEFLYEAGAVECGIA